MSNSWNTVFSQSQCTISIFFLIPLFRIVSSFQNLFLFTTHRSPSKIPFSFYSLYSFAADPKNGFRSILKNPQAKVIYVTCRSALMHESEQPHAINQKFTAVLYGIFQATCDLVREPAKMCLKNAQSAYSTCNGILTKDGNFCSATSCLNGNRI